eukprot:COSAG06_NODE_2193_length_7379_cov_2.537637_3_plen_175_part_00
MAVMQQHAPRCGFTPTSQSCWIAGVRIGSARPDRAAKSGAKSVWAAASLASVGSNALGSSARGCWSNGREACAAPPGLEPPWARCFCLCRCLVCRCFCCCFLWWCLRSSICCACASSSCSICSVLKCIADTGAPRDADAAPPSSSTTAPETSYSGPAVSGDVASGAAVACGSSQ